jgi:hypothetical protein
LLLLLAKVAIALYDGRLALRTDPRAHGRGASRLGLLAHRDARYIALIGSIGILVELVAIACTPRTGSAWNALDGVAACSGLLFSFPMMSMRARQSGDVRSLRDVALGKSVQELYVTYQRSLMKRDLRESDRRVRAMFGDAHGQGLAVVLCLVFLVGIYSGAVLGRPIPVAAAQRGLHAIESMVGDAADAPPSAPPTSEAATSSTTGALDPPAVDAAGEVSTEPPTTINGSGGPDAICGSNPLQQLERILPDSRAKAAFRVISEAGFANTGCPPNRTKTVGGFIVLELVRSTASFAVVIAPDGRATLIDPRAVSLIETALSTGAVDSVSGMYANAPVTHAEERRAFLYVLGMNDGTCGAMVRTEPQETFLALPSSVTRLVTDHAAGEGYVLVRGVPDVTSEIYEVWTIDRGGSLVDRTYVSVDPETGTAHDSEGNVAGRAAGCGRMREFLRAYPDGEQFMSRAS